MEATVRRDQEQALAASPTARTLPSAPTPPMRRTPETEAISGHSVRIDLAVDAAIITLRGAPDPAAFEAAADAVRALPGYTPGMARVWDFSAAEASRLGYSGLQEMLTILARSPGPAPRRAAYVCPPGAVYGVGRQWLALTEQDQTAERRLFTNLEAALAWISA